MADRACLALFFRLETMSGLAQFVAARGLGTLQKWCEEGYEAFSRIDENLSSETLQNRWSDDIAPRILTKYHPGFVGNRIALELPPHVGHI